MTPCVTGSLASSAPVFDAFALRVEYDRVQSDVRVSATVDEAVAVALGGVTDLPPVIAQAVMAGAGFEPAKAEPTRLQRVPFDRSGTPPGGRQFRAYPDASEASRVGARPRG
jgi:hypothetical protein